MTELLLSIAIIAVFSVMTRGCRGSSDTSRSSSTSPLSSTMTPVVTATPTYQLWANAALDQPVESVVPTETFISKWRATLSSGA